jgi:hypothetical protein
LVAHLVLPSLSIGAIAYQKPDAGLGKGVAASRDPNASSGNAYNWDQADDGDGRVAQLLIHDHSRETAHGPPLLWLPPDDQI